MKMVIQRVRHASVTIGGVLKSHIGKGMLILLGVATDDSHDDVDWLVKKAIALHIFDDAEGVMDPDVRQTGGDVMVVSQFTLLASTKKGNRPSYIHAAPPTLSIPLYEAFCRQMSQELGKDVATGTFGADMKVELLNDGPVTICMDSKRKE